MTPKEKAIELLNKYNSILIHDISHNAARNFSCYNCALLAVDQILDNTIGIGESGVEVSGDDIYSDLEFWEAVKSELESL